MKQLLNENIFHQYNKWKKGYERKENSLQMRLNDFLLNRTDMNADNFHISEDGKHVDCDETVIIIDLDLIDGKFPFPFGKVNGNFNCAQCENLTSLEGAPKEVSGFFNCRNCKNLKSLEGAPEKVGVGFNCGYCKNLKSLEGVPKKVNKWFICTGCKSLTSLKGAPEKVGEDFMSYSCPNLTSLEYLPKEINGKLKVDERFKGQIPSDILVNSIVYV